MSALIAKMLERCTNLNPDFSINNKNFKPRLKHLWKIFTQVLRSLVKSHHI